jgi:TBC1 domain family member 15
LPDRPKIPGRDEAVSEDTFNQFRGEGGRMKDVHALKSLIFRGGIERHLRPLLWKYLLGYFDWEKTAEENQLKRKQLSDEYFRMKLQWMTVSNEQESRFADFRDRKALIEKDVQRTDRSHSYFRNEANLELMHDILMTYVMYDFDLGYVQGMSDFLGPLMVVMDDEVDSFWTFVGLMKRVVSVFQLVCCLISLFSTQTLRWIRWQSRSN